MDLFGDSERLEKIPLVGGDVRYANHVQFSDNDKALFSRLLTETSWRSEKILLWGKERTQPRLVAWQGDRGAVYAYSGIKLNPLPWTPDLCTIKSKVEAIASAKFNSVLLNLYRNGNDSMGFHSDDEKELGHHPTIASVSFGEERTFILKHKTNKALKPVHLHLKSGSLLVMSGATQENWKHGIPKEPYRVGARVNITFRYISH